MAVVVGGGRLVGEGAAEAFEELRRHRLRLALRPDADVTRRSAEQDLVARVGNSVGEGDLLLVQFRHHHLDDEVIIVAGGGFVMQMRFHHREKQAVLVQRGQGHPRRTEELATSRLEDIQIACVIHMVAHRAIGVSHPVKVAEL